jgi:SAM-dependent MidA family methyltransferase
MTALATLLRRRIEATGPLTLADYMAECLLHSEHGYYTTRDPFGTAGDFTTAPEISQMFGELLGLGLAQAWLDQGEPAPFTLAELGPGRGTLMADLLRATRQVPGFHAAARVVLVEASPTLRARQRQALGDHPAQWADDISALPPDPLFLVANEFFDALPIRQFQRHPAGWQERMVGLQAGALAFGLSAPAPLAALAHRLEDTAPGDVVETCAPATAIAAQIGAHLAAAGGAALILDYGDWRSRGDTLQAMRGHAFADPLATPGEADLTAHVDFEVLALAARPALAAPLAPQGAFLERLGITARARALAHALSGPALDAHVAAHRRLTHPQEMGRLFKVLGLHAPGTAPPPGFA